MKKVIAFLVLSLTTLGSYADPGYFISDGWWMNNEGYVDRTYTWNYSDGIPTCTFANCNSPGGLYYAGFRFYGPVSSTNPSGYSSIHRTSATTVEIGSNDTFAMVVERFKSRFGVSGVVWMPRVNRSDINNYPYDCVAVYKTGTQGVGSISQSEADSRTCTRTRERSSDPATCDITGPTTIDHGLMELSDVNGKTAQINATVTCPVSTYVQYKIINQNVNLGKGVTSQIKVNNSTTPPYQMISAGVRTTVPISSTLVAANPQAGTLSGSSVIVVNVY